MIDNIKQFLLKPSSERGKLFNATIGTLQSVFWAVAITSIASFFIFGAQVENTPNPIDTSGYSVLGYDLSEYDESLNDLQLSYNIQFVINNQDAPRPNDAVSYKAILSNGSSEYSNNILSEIKDFNNFGGYVNFENNAIINDFKIREHPDEPFNILNRTFADRDFMLFEWLNLLYDNMYTYYNLERPEIVLNGLDTFKIFGFGDHFNYTIDKINLYNNLISQSDYDAESLQSYGGIQQNSLNYGSTAGQIRRILQFALIELESQLWTAYETGNNQDTNLSVLMGHLSEQIDYDGVQEWQPSLQYIYYAGYKIKFNLGLSFILPDGFSGCVDTSGGGLFG